MLSNSELRVANELNRMHFCAYRKSINIFKLSTKTFVYVNKTMPLALVNNQARKTKMMGLGHVIARITAFINVH